MSYPVSPRTQAVIAAGPGGPGGAIAPAVVPGTNIAVPAGFEPLTCCMSPGVDAVCYDTKITKVNQPIVKSWIVQEQIARPMRHNITFAEQTLPTQQINDCCSVAAPTCSAPVPPPTCGAPSCFAPPPPCAGGCGSLY